MYIMVEGWLKKIMDKLWWLCKAKLYPGEIWSGGKNVTVVVVIFLSGGKYFPGIFFPCHEILSG